MIRQARPTYRYGFSLYMRYLYISPVPAPKNRRDRLPFQALLPLIGADHGQDLRGAYHKLQRPVLRVAVYHLVPLVLQRTFPWWFGHTPVSLLALIVDTYEKLYYKQQAEREP